MIQTKSPKNFLPEIQGLRAIAVLAVLLFHVWPEALPGGYVGVDVFFVISGYLITGLLLREAQRSGRISLTNFYTRRIRRLLPASTLVILVSSIFVGTLPQVQWADVAKEALASTFYVQNWWLAHQAVDYLAEDSAASLLRHYWTLSVEEQYYIFWPLMFMATTLCCRAAQRRPGHTFALLALGVGGFSLIYSIYLTNNNPPLAYFATTTRAWEFALGGGLATLDPYLTTVKHLPRASLGWLGLSFIGFACFSFSESTAFPSYTALLPTIGAALVILAEQAPQVWASNRFLRLKPMQYVGDISYSLYLWHWPVLVIYGALMPSLNTTWHHGLFTVGLSVILAHLSKRWVEDPFRRGNWGQLNWINSPGAIVIMSFGAVFLAASIILLQVDRSNSLKSFPIKLLSELAIQPYDSSQPTVPSFEMARQDNPDVYRLKCHADQRSSEPSSCSFGLASAKRVVALVGDSHAAQWLPTLQEIYRGKLDWRIVTYTKSACAFNAATVIIGKGGRPYESCSAWNERVLAELEILRPDIVVMSASSTYRVFGIDDKEANLNALIDGFLVRWNQLLQTGTKLIVIRDTPRMVKNIPECMSASKATVEDCSILRNQALHSDPITLAAERKPRDWSRFVYLDLADQICEGEICKPVRGQILIWRDSHHMTATFARFLAGKVGPLLLNE